MDSRGWDCRWLGGISVYAFMIVYRNQIATWAERGLHVLDIVIADVGRYLFHHYPTATSSVECMDSGQLIGLDIRIIITSCILACLSHWSR